MKEKVPVVPPPRKPGDPIPEIHPSREPEDNPWLETYIDLGNVSPIKPADTPAHADDQPGPEQKKAS
jgi:hypothetical protein